MGVQRVHPKLGKVDVNAEVDKPVVWVGVVMLPEQLPHLLVSIGPCSFLQPLSLPHGPNKYTGTNKYYLCNKMELCVFDAFGLGHGHVFGRLHGHGCRQPLDVRCCHRGLLVRAMRAMLGTVAGSLLV